MKIKALKTFPFQISATQPVVNYIKDREYNLECPDWTKKLKDAGYIEVVSKKSDPKLDSETKVIEPENKEVVLDTGKPEPETKAPVDKEVEAEKEAKASLSDRIKKKK